MSEPAIQVRRKGRGTQLWSIDKMENRLVDMRDHYRDWKDDGQDRGGDGVGMIGLQRGLFQLNRCGIKPPDPFDEAQENHHLIGVANVFLESLFHDVRLQHAVPIISQQGEVHCPVTPL